LICTLKLGVTRERQDKVYGAAFYASEHFGEQPDEENEHKAKIALDKAREASPSKNRENILQSSLQLLSISCAIVVACGYWKPGHSSSSFVQDGILCSTLSTHASPIPLSRRRTGVARCGSLGGPSTTWSDGNGSWGAAGNWTSGTPNASTNACILDSTSAVTLDTNGSALGLQLATGNSLHYVGDAVRQVNHRNANRLISSDSSRLRQGRGGR
jgi:hypothetical protein